MNGKESDRNIGLDLAFSDNPSQYKFPKLVVDPNIKYEDVPDCKQCRTQGFFNYYELPNLTKLEEFLDKQKEKEKEKKK